MHITHDNGTDIPYPKFSLRIPGFFCDESETTFQFAVIPNWYMQKQTQFGLSTSATTAAGVSSFFVYEMILK